MTAGTGLTFMRRAGVPVAQSVKPSILDFGSGHDLTVVRLSPTSGSMLGGEPAWDSLSLSLSLSFSPSLPLPCSHTLSLKQNKKIYEKGNLGSF